MMYVLEFPREVTRSLLGCERYLPRVSRGALALRPWARSAMKAANICSSAAKISSRDAPRGIALRMRSAIWFARLVMLDAGTSAGLAQLERLTRSRGYAAPSRLTMALCAGF